MDRRVTYPQEFRFPTFPPPQGFVFVRGDFRNKGEPVTPGTPAVLPPLPEGPANRLTLAR